MKSTNFLLMSAKIGVNNFLTRKYIPFWLKTNQLYNYINQLYIFFGALVILI